MQEKHYLSPVVSQEIVGKTSSLPGSSLCPFPAIPQHSGDAVPPGTVLFVHGGVEGGICVSHGRS